MSAHTTAVNKEKKTSIQEANNSYFQISYTKPTDGMSLFITGIPLYLYEIPFRFFTYMEKRQRATLTDGSFDIEYRTRFFPGQEEN